MIPLAELERLRMLDDDALARLADGSPAVDGTADQLAIDSFAAFVGEAWPIVEPRYPVEWAPYLSILCGELEAVARGDVRDLVICLPPGVSKSLLVSVLFPAWLWLHRPSERVLTVSNADKLSTRDSRRTRDVLRSPWYRRLVDRTGLRGRTGKPWAMTRDQDEKVNFVNDSGGAREAVGITSTNTGVRVDGLIVDDPHDASAAMGGAAEVAIRMADVVERFDTVLANRVDSVRGWRIVVMQRLDAGDLAGVLIGRGVRACVLAMGGDPDRLDRHPLDMRARGELLHPRFVSANADARARGSRYYGAQYDQAPISAQGGTFRREWLRWYSVDPKTIAVESRAMSADLTFKATAGSDRVALQVWGRRGLDRYLLFATAARMTYSESKRALVAIAHEWAPDLILVEDKANGPALIDDLRDVLAGLVPFNPGAASKQARAQLASTAFEAGHVYLPTSEVAPWVGDYERELLAFPAHAHDDQVDATSQIVLHWGASEDRERRLLEALAASGV